MSNTVTTLPARELAAQIKIEHLAVKEAAQSVVTHAMRCGDLLIEAKAKVAHGEWLPWLEKECCGIGERTAQHYMRLARNRGEIESLNPKQISDLTLTEALKVIGLKALAKSVEEVEEVEDEPDEADPNKAGRESVHKAAAKIKAASSPEPETELDRLPPAMKERFIEDLFADHPKLPPPEPPPPDLAAYEERKEQEATAANIFNIRISDWCETITRIAQDLYGLGAHPDSGREQFAMMLESPDFLKAIDRSLGWSGNCVYAKTIPLNWKFVDADVFRAGTERLIEMIEAVRAKKGVPIPALVAARAEPAPAPEPPAAPETPPQDASAPPETPSQAPAAKPSLAQRKRDAIARANAIGEHDLAEQIEADEISIQRAEKELAAG